MSGFFGGGGSGGGLPSGLTYAAPTFTVSTAGTGNGVLALSGNTSGTFTLTSDATGANGTFNGNIITPNGSAGSPSIIPRTGVAVGLGSYSATELDLNTTAAGTIKMFSSATESLRFTLSTTVGGQILMGSFVTGVGVQIAGDSTSAASAVPITLTNNGAGLASATVQQFGVQTLMTFNPASGSAPFSAVIAQPTINQTGGANGAIRVVASYPVNTALVGTEYLFAGGTSSAVGTGATLTDKFLVDSTGNETTTDTNGGTWVRGSASELLTLSTGGTTTDTAANLLPAGAIIQAVCCRVTTTITTATNWSVGDPTTAARFSAANSTLTSGTTSVGLDHMSGAVTTLAAGPSQAAAAKVRITTTGTPGAGVIRITVFYMQFTAPTS